MGVKIKITGKFERDYWELLESQPELEKQISWTLDKFKNNPQDTRLGVHKLTKRMTGKFAIKVTDDIRIIFKWLDKNVARLLDIGGHEKVYRRKRMK